jgi:hypothetical protein
MNNMANLDKVDVPHKNQKRKPWLMFMQLVPAGYVRKYED